MSTEPPAMRGLPSRSVFPKTKALLPALMQGELDCKRPFASKSGALVMLPSPEVADWPVRVQLLVVYRAAPPPSPPELAVSVQLVSVLEDAPPPKLPMRVQLMRVPPYAPPTPLVKVNP